VIRHADALRIRPTGISGPFKKIECIGYACCNAIWFFGHKAEKSAKTDKRFRS